MGSDKDLRVEAAHTNKKKKVWRVSGGGGSGEREKLLSGEDLAFTYMTLLSALNWVLKLRR